MHALPPQQLMLLLLQVQLSAAGCCCLMYVHAPALLLLLLQLLLQFCSCFSRCHRYNLMYVHPLTPATDADAAIAVVALQLHFLLLSPLPMCLLLLPLPPCWVYVCPASCWPLGSCLLTCTCLSSVCDNLSMKSIISISTMIWAYHGIWDSIWT